MFDGLAPPDGLLDLSDDTGALRLGGVGDLVEDFGDELGLLDLCGAVGVVPEVLEEGAEEVALAASVLKLLVEEALALPEE